MPISTHKSKEDLKEGGLFNIIFLMRNITSPSDLSCDVFPKINLSVFQYKSSFLFGIDALLLSDFVKIRQNARVVDLGTGTGIIPLLLAKSCRTGGITALEIQDEFFELASKNVKINQLEERINVVHGDIKNVPSLFKPETAECVTSNPPYAKAESSRKSQNLSKDIARRELLCNLEDVVRAASWLLKSGGSFFMIHRPERLPEIFSFFTKYRLTPKVLQFVHPFSDSEPTMILIEGKKNAGSALKILPPLFVYQAPGLYSEKVMKIKEGYF